MTQNRSLSLFEIWQNQLDNSATYWQSLLSIQRQDADPFTWWQPIMDQSCVEWSALWHQWQQVLNQWLENGYHVAGRTLQANTPFDVIFPPLDDLSRLHKMAVDFVELLVNNTMDGFGALALGRVSAITEQIERLETAVAKRNQHLETLAERFNTSDTAISQQVDVLRGQIQMTHDALTQYLDALSKRVDALKSSGKEFGPRSPTRRKPKP